MSEGSESGWPSFGDPGEHDEPRGSAEEPTLVRPYTRTGGRTRASDADLSLESLISVTEKGRSTSDALQADHRAICRLCLEPQSVMEIAALLRIPLGVARILVSDLASTRMVFVHPNEPMLGDRPSVDFLERVLSGLHRL
jgi:hypothetical protein